MIKKAYFCHLSLVFFSLSEVTMGWSTDLDKDTDLFYNWRLEGGYEYYQNGGSLHILNDILPKDFDYGTFKNAEGIWAIVPETNSGVNLTENSALFQFASTAQLIASVDITYCIYGGAIILLKNSPESLPLFTVKPSNPVVFEFVTMQIPINPSSRFVVEGTVFGDEGFILIDRIRANYLEVTTPKHRTTSPTPKPIVSPAASFSIPNLSFPLLVVLTVWTIQ